MKKLSQKSVNKLQRTLGKDGMQRLACDLPRTPALAAFWARVNANLKAAEKPEAKPRKER